MKDIKFSQGIAYQLNEAEDGVIVVGIGSCKDEDIVIPSSYSSLPVKAVFKRAFYQCDFIKSITLPDSVTSISHLSFSGCKNLTKIKLSKNLTRIGKGAFSYCSSLKEITLPSSLVTLEGGVFQGSGIEKIDIPAKVKNINSLTFSECTALKEVILPKDIVAIGDFAFEGCTLLSKIDLPSSIALIGANAFSSCAALTSIIIPDSVKEIKERAFYNCGQLKKVKLPSSLSKIENHTFEKCRLLEDITLPDSVKIIDDGAFKKCKSLTHIYIPKNVEFINYNSFRRCSSIMEIVVDEANKKYDSRNHSSCIIETATNKLIYGCKGSVIPQGVEEIEELAFWKCKYLTSIAIPSSVKKINQLAFAGCKNLKEVQFSEGLTTIGNGAFWGCESLEKIALPTSVISLGDKNDITCRTFSECSSLKEIEVKEGNPLYESKHSNAIIEKKTHTLILGCINTKIPQDVTTIGEFAFAGCKMEHMVIPNHITNIKFNAFSWCDHLKEIDISSSVSELGREMFLACSSLTTIRVDKDNQVFDSRDNSNAIINTELNTLIYGCAGTTIPSSVTAIAPGAFSDSSLEEIMIPGNVVTLGASAFARNRLLKKVIIEPGVKEIGYKAFGECASLETLVIPQSVRSVDDNICSKCPQVEIYCEHHQKPSLWSDDFSLGDKKVYWKKDWEYINGVPTKIN